MFFYTIEIKKVICDINFQKERELSSLLRLVSIEVFREAEMRGYVYRHRAGELASASMGPRQIHLAGYLQWKPWSAFRWFSPSSKVSDAGMLMVKLLD